MIEYGLYIAEVCMVRAKSCFVFYICSVLELLGSYTSVITLNTHRRHGFTV